MIPEAKVLAFEFSRLLRLYLTENAMLIVVERNRNEPHSNICHSHDFIDANEVMHEAWTALGGLEFHPFENPEAVRAWGGAWEIARQTEFSAINPEHYRLAIAGEGPQAAEWNNKPHRLVYDLAKEVTRLQAKLTGSDILAHCTAEMKGGDPRSEYFNMRAAE